MKFLQKATLAAAIAAAPFAAQSLEALDDATLAATTGQAGVTIEIDIEGAGVTVGEIEYTDTQAGSDTDGGSVLLQNININNVAGLTQEIDVDATGDLKITQSGVSGMTVSLGDVAGTADNTYSAVALKGANGTAEVVDSLAMNLDLGSSTITIHNMANGDTLGTAAGVTGTHASDTSSIAIQMASSIKINDLDAQLFGYTEAQAEAKVRSEDGLAASDPLSAAQQAKVAALADGGAVTITNLSFDNNGNAATMNQTIWAAGDGVYIQMGAIEGDLAIGSIGIGNDAAGQPLSIGSLAVRDINLSGLTQKISGH